MLIKTKPLTQKSYQPYGDVISVRDDISPVSANMGTAKRYNFLTKLENLRPGKAEANLSVFRCDPQLSAPQVHLEIHLLEKHPHSTQVFIPMAGAERFLVVVCLGDKAPDLSTLQVFVANSSQGMTYKPGVWHHPLIAMDRPSNFACLVWEDGGQDDGEVVELNQMVKIEIV